MSIDVKKAQLHKDQRFNLGHVSKWSEADIELLVEAGCVVNHVNFLHAPFDIITGTVPFGQKDRKNGIKPNLRVNGIALVFSEKKRFVA